MQKAEEKHLEKHIEEPTEKQADNEEDEDCFEKLEFEHELMKESTRKSKHSMEMYVYGLLL